MSKALLAYTGYKGNSLLLIDEDTAYDFGMQMAHKSMDEQGVRQIDDPIEEERNNLVDNLWYERRVEATGDEKTQEPKFYKELATLFKRTEPIDRDDLTPSSSPSQQWPSMREPTWSHRPWCYQQ